ncbi:MAG: 1-deoxy-D-xylulose-5-phosphate synthase [Deltaproteobacteria bacterium]|nr:1-deoxy-D-xylulose-5-phosphate synthase [Deltaproteobacteria bacterium]
MSVHAIQRDAFINEITEAALQDRDVYFISADMGAVALDAYREKLPDQFVFSGISEQNTIDVAAGLAASGKRVYTYAMASFITARCYEPLRYMVGMMSLPITVLGVGVGLGYEDAGPAHNTTEDIAFMRTLHGIEILSPADVESSVEIARLTYRDPGFRYIRLERPKLPEVYGGRFAEALPRGMCTLAEGDETCIVASGFMLHRALEVARELKRDGLRIGVIDLFRSTPIDGSVLLAELSPYRNVVTLEEQALAAGMGSAVVEVLADEGEHKNVLRLGLPGRYLFENGGRDYILSQCGLGVAQIADRVRAFAATESA